MALQRIIKRNSLQDPNDVIEVADFASLPGTGESERIYIATDTGVVYFWNGAAYTTIGGLDLANADEIDADNGSEIVKVNASTISAFLGEIEFEYIGDQNTTILKHSSIFREANALKSDLSGLEAINEGNGIGWRFVGTNPDNYGNIGAGAVDFGVYYTNPLQGATGTSAFNVGEDNIISGYFGFGVGYANINAGDYSTSFGGENTIDASQGAFVNGYLNTVTTGGVGYSITSGARNNQGGSYGGVFGLGLINRSFATTIVGQGNTDYTNTTGGLNSPLAPHFVVGNGVALGGSPNNIDTRSDAFIVRHNGILEAPSLTTTLIDADATGKVLTTKEWVSESLVLEGYSESGTVLDEDLLVKIGDPAGFNVLLDLANKVFEGSGFKFSIGDYGEIRLSLGDVNNDYNGAKLIFDDYEGVWDFTDGVINMKNCAAVYLPENTMITTDDDDSNIHFDLSHQGGNKVKLKVPKMNTTDGVFLTGMTVRTIPISSTSQGYKGEVIFDGATKYECVEDDTWVKSTVITTF